MSSGYISIPREQFFELVAAQEKLDKLEAGGVDNWEGYDEAMSAPNDDGSAYEWDRDNDDGA